MLTNVLNNAIDRSVAASEALYTAFAPIPESRDDDEEYDAGPQSSAGKLLEGMRKQLLKGPHNPIDATALSAVIDAAVHGDHVDDRKLLLEKTLYIMSNLPGGPVSKFVQDKVISLLWYDLPHPPATYIADEYRHADGSGNNPHFPDLGKAGSSYSRNVQSTTAMPDIEQPDPALVFDSLLRREAFVEHPAGNSSLMFGFATLVIHNCFRTNHGNYSQNETSSYVDLSPLYGNDEEGQDRVRNKEGRGMLYNDVFAEDRLLFLPPIAVALLILYCRNHNHIAEKILQINERKTWVDPNNKEKWDKLKPDQILKQDNDIFNMARLINCGHFASAVFSDYVAAILGLVTDLNSWTLDPFNMIRKSDHSLVDRGQGNSNSVEFNLLYRWHATLSEADEKWVEDMFTKEFNGTSWDKIEIDDFKKVTEKLKAEGTRDVRKWTFNKLKREDDGKFKDGDLAKILMDATEHPAGAFKARGTPSVMKIVEVMTMKMSRKWGVCTLNEFRKSLGLRQYKTFQEWNPRKEIWQAAQKLYETVDRLELHPGLQAEETKLPGPGAGLCPGFTISRAILADAISLTRGDRFYTHAFTPFNYTAWGYRDCQRDPTNPGFGSAIGPLLLRGLPHHYTENSVYTWFGMITPVRMKEILTKAGLADRYTFERPKPTYPPTPVENYTGVSEFLGKNARAFRSLYSRRAQEILDGPGYLPNMDDPRTSRNAKIIHQAIFHDHEYGRVASAIAEKIKALIFHKGFELEVKGTKTFDVVKDVLNLAPIHWIAEEIGLPLKTAEFPRGVIFEQQADQGFKDIYEYIFLELDPARSMHLKENARKHVKTFQYHMRTHLRGIGHSGIFGFAGYIKDALWNVAVGTKPASEHFYQVMNTVGLSEQELVNDVLAVAALATVELSHMLVHIVNFYLEKENKAHCDRLVQVACSNSPSAIEILARYAREALRLDPVTVGITREVGSAMLIPGVAKPVNIHPGDKVFLSLKKANLDEPKTHATRCHPAIEDSHHYEVFLGDGVVRLLGENFVLTTAAHVLKVIFSLKGIKRAPGPSGCLRRYSQSLHGTPQYFYLDTKQRPTLWPTSMLVQYEAN